MTYEITIDVKQGDRQVTRLVLSPLTAEHLIRGARKEFEDAERFLRGCIRADVENHCQGLDSGQDIP